MLQGHSTIPHFTTLVYCHTRKRLRDSNHHNQLHFLNVTRMHLHSPHETSMPQLLFIVYYLCIFFHFGLEFVSFHVNSLSVQKPSTHAKVSGCESSQFLVNPFFFPQWFFVFIWKWTWHAFSALLYCCLTLCCWFKQSPQWILYCHLKRQMWKWQWSFSHLKASRFKNNEDDDDVIINEPVGRFQSR